MDASSEKVHDGERFKGLVNRAKKNGIRVRRVLVGHMTERTSPSSQTTKACNQGERQLSCQE